MSTDGAYGNCIDETAKLYSRSGGLVYFYSYEYRGTNSMLDLLVNLQNEVNTMQAKNNRISNGGQPWFEFDKGVCHGDELFSLFSLKTGNLRQYSERDLFTQKRLITLWTEFASTNFNQSNQMNYYSMNQFNFINPLDHFGSNRKINNLFLGPNAFWPSFNENNQYLVINDNLKVLNNYRKQELDFWKLLFDSELLTIERFSQTEQLDYLNGQKYTAFVYIMLTTTICLMIVISFLLIILYWYSKKTRSFKTTIPSGVGICHSNPAMY